MDTTVMNSWYELVRLTDPLIWSLAVETEPDSTAQHLSHLQQQQQAQDHHQQHDIPSVSSLISPPPPLPVLSSHAFSSSPSSSTASTARESVSVTHAYKNSFCRSLLDPHPQNALDWLKCLIESSCYDDHAREQSRQHAQGRDHQMALDTSLDFGCATKAMFRRKEPSSIAGGFQHHNQGAEEAVAMVASAGTTGASCSNSASTTGSYRHSSSGTTKAPYTKTAHPPLSDSHVVSRSDNHAVEEGSVGSSFGNAASTGPSTGPSTAAAAATHSVSRSETGSPNSLVGEQPTSRPTAAAVAAANATSAAAADADTVVSDKVTSISATTLHTLSSASSNSQAVASNPNHANTHTDALTTVHATTKKSEPNDSNTSSSSSSVSSPPSSPSLTTKNTTDTTISTMPSRFLALLPLSTTTTFHNASDMMRHGWIRSKDATTAFLYRTFSPTYRISKLYADSWFNGSQRRGLKKIKNSVVRGDAFVLMRGTTNHMRVVWNQVMAAYRTKYASSGVERGKRLGSNPSSNPSKSKSKGNSNSSSRPRK